MGSGLYQRERRVNRTRARGAARVPVLVAWGGNAPTTGVGTGAVPVGART
ncbi:hypothetical protein [Brachybacterium sacelli]